MRTHRTRCAQCGRSVLLKQQSTEDYQCDECWHQENPENRESEQRAIRRMRADRRAAQRRQLPGARPWLRKAQ